jgi:CBS domain-containing protein
MQIAEVMTPAPITCAPETTVAEAARLMWEGDCGVLPVVNGRTLDGVVTDRDLFIALATRNAKASELTVGSVAHGSPITCTPLVGIVSMNDLVLTIAPETSLGGQVVDTLQTISEHQLPVPVAKHATV